MRNKKKKDFEDIADLLLTTWMRFLKESRSSLTPELSDKLDASVGEFLNKFISKFLKIVGNSNETQECKFFSIL